VTRRTGQARLRPADPARPAYQRGEDTKLLTCARPGCGAGYLDDGPGRAAHKTVFGHAPRKARQHQGGRR
jgi:hypothetical protein